jgi:hypothetical protein
MRETEIDRGGRVLRVRDAGDPGGAEVMYFHADSRRNVLHRFIPVDGGAERSLSRDGSAGLLRHHRSLLVIGGSGIDPAQRSVANH